MKSYEYEDMRRGDANKLRKRASRLLAAINDWESGYTSTDDLKQRIYDIREYIDYAMEDTHK